MARWIRPFAIALTSLAACSSPPEEAVLRPVLRRRPAFATAPPLPASPRLLRAATQASSPTSTSSASPSASLLDGRRDVDAAPRASRKRRVYLANSEAIDRDASVEDEVVDGSVPVVSDGGIECHELSSGQVRVEGGDDRGAGDSGRTAESLAKTMVVIVQRGDAESRHRQIVGRWIITGIR